MKADLENVIKSSGYPTGFCAIGATVRMREGDFRRIRNEHLRKAELWHRFLKKVVSERIEHEAACHDCGGRKA